MQSRGRRERQGHWPHLHNPILATHLTSSIATHRQFFISLMIIAKDCLLTLVKRRLALGSPGCLFGWLFVTMPKMAEYTEISC